VLSAINRNIDPSFWWLTALTLPLWLAAVGVNIHAARHGIVELARVRAATAMLALIYFVAQCVLLFSTVQTATWSDIMRGVQFVTIPVVWILPAAMSLKMARRVRETDRKLRARDLVKEDEDDV
jgi:hypothetical protein